MATRHRNDGLRKVCRCARAAWTKCPHPWHFNYKWAGVHYRLSLDRYLPTRVTTKGDARIAANELRAKIQAGRPLRAVASPALPPSHTLTDLLGAYRREYLETERAATMKNVGYQIGVIMRTPLLHTDGTLLPFGDWRVDDIRASTIERYRAARRLQGVVTTNRDLSLLRAMFAWAVRLGYVEQSPFKRGHEPVVKLTREAPRARRLDPDEGDRLLRACSPHLRALIEGALESGCRKGELLSLQWSQVRRAAPAEVTLPAAKTKTRRDRRIPISARLELILDMRATALRTALTLEEDATLPGELYVFGDDKGAPVITFKRAWESAVLRSHGYVPAYVTRPRAKRVYGLRRPRGSTAALTPTCRQQLRTIDLHFHDLRREAGSRWLEGGVLLHTIRDWLGHANIAQTSTYLACALQGQHEAMRLFDARRHALQQSATTATHTAPVPSRRTAHHKDHAVKRH